MQVVTEILLKGTVNTRDVGGLALADASGRTRAGVLLRSDNLQDLTAADVRHLVDDLQVRRVVDLRTDVELRGEGPGPLTAEPGVRIDHLSLFPEAGNTTDFAADADVRTPGPDILPWAQPPQNPDDRQAVDEVRQWSDVPVARVYLRYLRQRPDSIVAALREVAAGGPGRGSTLVHCAAGKDRTGVVVALALDVIGVDRDAIVADYLATVPHAAAILARLQGSPTYAADVRGTTVVEHAPRPETMPAFLLAVEAHLGGTRAFLASHGWTADDTVRLAKALVEPAR